MFCGPRQIILLIAGMCSASCAAVKQPEPTVYTLHCGAHRLRFAFPTRWYPQPASSRNALIFAPGSPTNAPAVQITVTPRKPALQGLDDYAAQERLVHDYLVDLRRTSWSDAGILREDKLRSRDDREIFQWLELSNTRHLVSFVPFQECVAEINMWGEEIDQPASRDDFKIVVSSLRVE